MEVCPCGSGREYAECCGALISGAHSAQTAEALMRARYSAFAKTEVDFIINTTVPHRREGVQAKSIRNWSQNAEWQKLEIIDTQKGGPEDSEGKVEFIAYYREESTRRKHHEVADFVKKEGIWYFNDATNPTPKQVIRADAKQGRNEPCACGSGRKHKKCCGR